MLYSRDSNLRDFFTTFIAAWSDLNTPVTGANREQLIAITLVMHESLSPLWSGLSEVNAAGEKHKQNAARRLIARLKEKDLWGALTAHRPDLERLAELIER